MVDILKATLIVGGGVLVIVSFLLLIYILILYFQLQKINKSLQSLVWDFKLTKLGVQKTFYFLNYIFKKNGFK